MNNNNGMSNETTKSFTNTDSTENNNNPSNPTTTETTNGSILFTVRLTTGIGGYLLTADGSLAGIGSSTAHVTFPGKIAQQIVDFPQGYLLTNLETVQVANQPYLNIVLTAGDINGSKKTYNVIYKTENTNTYPWTQKSDATSGYFLCQFIFDLSYGDIRVITYRAQTFSSLGTPPSSSLSSSTNGTLILDNPPSSSSSSQNIIAGLVNNPTSSSTNTSTSTNNSLLKSNKTGIIIGVSVFIVLLLIIGAWKVRSNRTSELKKWEQGRELDRSLTNHNNQILMQQAIQQQEQQRQQHYLSNPIPASVPPLVSTAPHPSHPPTPTNITLNTSLPSSTTAIPVATIHHHYNNHGPPTPTSAPSPANLMNLDAYYTPSFHPSSSTFTNHAALNTPLTSIYPPSSLPLPPSSHLLTRGHGSLYNL